MCCQAMYMWFNTRKFQGRVKEERVREFTDSKNALFQTKSDK